MNNQQADELIDLASEVAGRYQISSLGPLLGSCRVAPERNEISVAVVGRFQAGKSSFLNHLLTKDFLPVRAVPVTAIVTEISYGPEEKATVYFLDSRTEEVRLDSIRRFIAETENPENVKQVSRVTVELPTLERFRGLRFADLPGLESVLTHNTEAALDWLPNVGLAPVAVSVDPPLTRSDVALLKSLYQYTPEA